MSPYLGVNNSSNLVFKYFFIYKITYIKNNFENSEKTKKSENSEKI